ncbi:hypothetical protein KP79_PYT24078 [Mizuhopecten yessoensis]|uniref:Copper acquisition factor BIM1-like domain-containing protein n=1 Tax=Mizuhopecten yessoensis TaxID=6573 RepID=A0A210QWG4_MIZYE|nr:hypothetical protein KP79_PYT24078 [Mizuhopecten yessoensis]
MASAVFVVIVFSAVIAVSYSHVCLLSPAQRGSLQGINKPGADNCILLKPPCGGRERQSNRTVELRDITTSMTTHRQGFFAIFLGRDGDQDYQGLVKIPDKGEPALSIYTSTIVIPAVPWVNKDAVLQIIYKTMNSDAPPAFYQCADVRILPKN